MSLLVLKMSMHVGFYFLNVSIFTYLTNTDPSFLVAFFYWVMCVCVCMSVHVCEYKCRCVGEVEEVVYSLFSLTFHFPKGDAISSVSTVCQLLFTLYYQYLCIL